MDDWTETARKPNITRTPRSEFADSAGEKLFLYELGEYALTEKAQIDTLPHEESIEELGRQLDRLVTSKEVPSLLSARQELAEEVGCNVEDITLQEANTHRKQVMIESIPSEKFETLVRSFL